jgi:magnesium and cobalt transporter
MKPNIKTMTNEITETPILKTPNKAAKVLSLPAHSNQSAQKSAEREGLIKRFRQWLRVNMIFGSKDNTLKEALVEVIEESQQAGVQLQQEEKNMLKNVLSFGDMTVSDVMVPRSDIQAVENTVTLEEIKKHVIEQRHTRVPVYFETLDNIKGFVHIKDLVPVLSGEAVYDLSQILRNILFVPPSMKIIDLLVKMRLSRVHIAIVVDEHGGTDGLITMENLFEQIVGDIEDEHDEQDLSGMLIWSAQRTCDLDAKTPVSKIEKDLSISLYAEDGTPEDFDSIGGLIFYHAGKVPSKFEKISYHHGIVFEVLDADPRRIKRVRISSPDPLAVSDSV